MTVTTGREKVIRKRNQDRCRLELQRPDGTMRGLLLTNRAWLQLYEPGVRRTGSSTDLCSLSESEDDQQFLPFELWVLISTQLSAHEPLSLCRLAAACRSLRPLGRHPELWERCCRAVFSMPGNADADDLLRFYAWSWRTMFQRRPRLRTDGVYYITTTKILKSTQEGRGMKEADKDLYSPAGLWVTSYRVLRFFPDGSMFSHLCASQTPYELRKAAGGVSATRPGSLGRLLRGACWGMFRLHEAPEGGGDDTIGVCCRVALRSEQYPNMAPATVVYR